MFIRQAAPSELKDIMDIYDRARDYMRTSGNMAQWVNGYPGEGLVLEDIRNGFSHICMDGGRIAAVFSLVTGEDPTYKEIYDGRWLNENPYGTVHRIAVAIHQKGVAAFCLDWCLQKCGNVRVDTHEDNLPMRGLLTKCGFTYCGVIYLPDGSPRFAYQKTEG
ncbi:hypothetical protein SAMN02745823_00272 [Sporobacter termitidis DSM 10068]|uniref:N-acetyltransferase domain-containing protein n=1 Tax=Sporobacter termitidis DSM 10068 TaxID=1123282 RepID=A0A1M5TXP4_9FIRM|nr:GNAT family N-acetyltransferase [Sporobacter termitidis]SHH55458.1 hypothetical protein SAMN02745823_00272 [Sporobacter termitidis DSM 10068]